MAVGRPDATSFDARTHTRGRQRQPFSVMRHRSRNDTHDPLDRGMAGTSIARRGALVRWHAKFLVPAPHITRPDHPPHVTLTPRHATI
jgi:hypothetical protein